MTAYPDRIRFATRRIDLLLALQGARLAMWTYMNDGSEVLLE